MLRFSTAGCNSYLRFCLVAALLVDQLRNRSTPTVSQWLITLHTQWPAPRQSTGWLA